ncbi:MAG: hypothetical protein ACE5EE_10235 [Fidelibacterota bacterium]
MDKSNKYPASLRYYFFIIFGSLILSSPSIIFAQDEDEDEGVFWEDEEYFDEDTTEYFDEDTSEFYEDEFYYDEEDTADFYYGDEDTADFFEDEYIYGEEEEDELTDLEFAEEGERQGYTVQLTAASPGYVNHTLETWNSKIDFRVNVDLPMLMEVGPVKFRIGAELGSFSFKNYLPVGGEFSGISVLGVLSFPAGPSTVQVGGGIMGSSPAIMASQSFGINIAAFNIRVGIRTTMAFNLPEGFKTTDVSANWLDGFVSIGYTL